MVITAGSGADAGARVNLRLELDALVAAVAKRFAGRAAAAAQPGFSAFEDDLPGCVTNRDLSLQMQGAIRGGNQI
jgi:hypothetical protein